MNFIIKPYQQKYWQQCWAIIEPIFRAGETYPCSPQMSEAEAHHYWIETPLQTYIAVDENDQVVGSYYLKPNQPTLGAHVCNCGYLTAEQSRGKGVATLLCEHSQAAAKQYGFKAMQFNLVVSTNNAAVNLWKKLGFDLVGTLPKAFKSQQNGYIDAFVMYKELC
jgi:RimJ/RimL family protein N-acetyltransferase